MSKEAEVLSGDTLELKCAILPEMDMAKGELSMHLYKNGNITMRGTSLVTSLGDVVFTLPQVTREDSGNYSCMYRTAQNTTKANTVIGHDSVLILQVKGNVPHFRFQNKL